MKEKAKQVEQVDSSGNVVATHPSICQAAKAIGVNESSIRRAIRRSKKCLGYHWRTSVATLAPRRRLPKILILDIETAPSEALVWRMYKENISPAQISSDWYIICWSAKWLFGDTILSDRLSSYEAKAKDDRRILSKLWGILDEADIVIAHNGSNFDIPKINARLIVSGFKPTSPYRQIDTLLVARKQFAFSHNSLNALAAYFGIEAKLETTFQLWRDCYGGNEEALEYMEKYNRNDVQILEEVYLKMRPWMAGHPNFNAYMETDGPVCASCGSKHIEEDSFYYTQVNKYVVYRCRCGALSRGRVSVLTKEDRKRMLTSI